MLALLIPLLWLALVAAVRAVRPPTPVRDALVIAAVLTAGWAALGAELLSLPRWLSPVPVFLWWAAPVLVLLPWLPRPWPVLGFEPAPAPAADRTRTLALLAPAAAVLALTLAVALLTPPTTWDALSYHLPRQLFWVQQQGVQHMPVADLRQLESPPLAEYIGVQLMLLARGDRAANMVQWSAFALSALAASAIARDLGATRPGQAFAALLIVCLPSAATQAVNAKNDVLVGFFVLALMHVAVRTWTERSFPIGRALYAGLALGLLLLTKGTGWAYGAPLGALIGLAALRAGWRVLPPGALAAALAVAITAPHLARNMETFGHPLGLPADRGGVRYASTIHTPGAIASSLVRASSLQLGTPWPSANAAVRRAVEHTHEWIGLSVADPRTTSLPKPGFRVSNEWTTDGNNPAPVHLLFLAAIGALAILRPRGTVRVPAWPVYFLPPAMFLLFCALLAWQPWNNRLMIPIFMSVAPVAAAAPGIPGLRPGRTAAAVAVSVLIWPPVLLNQSKRLVGPDPIWSLPRRQARIYVEPPLRSAIDEAVSYLQRVHAEHVALGVGWANLHPLLEPLTWELRPRPALTIIHPNFGPPLSGNPARRPDATIGAVPPPGPPSHLILWPRASSAAVIHAGWVYRPVVQRAQFGLYERAEAGNGPTPQFAGWTASQGLEPPIVAPRAPAGHSAAGPVTTLTFDSQRATPSGMSLLIVGRSDNTPGRLISLRLNGKPAGSFTPASPRFPVLYRATLPCRPGENILEIRYGPAEAAQRPFQFQSLVIAPVYRDERSPGAAGGPP